ncbi:Hypothetical predicted protein [Olea europaea subsp. europaea]|uniref:Uncharacterized protein n=1 Tax=Olea europaea subsp. europaea TaxID=158383 RepID=A0A8S0SEP8_OLEEU|nr:Hypothetical predicted protein [Olea europaea subsp. europaea]
MAETPSDLLEISSQRSCPRKQKRIANSDHSTPIFGSRNTTHGGGPPPLELSLHGASNRRMGHCQFRTNKVELNQAVHAQAHRTKSDLPPSIPHPRIIESQNWSY